MNYYILVPKSICDEHRVFSMKPTLPDGRVIITPRDLAYTTFSYGPVELLNEQSLLLLRQSQEAENDAAEETDNAPKAGDAPATQADNHEGGGEAPAEGVSAEDEDDDE